MASSPMKKSRSSTPLASLRVASSPTLAVSFTAIALGIMNWGSLLPAYPNFEYLKREKISKIRPPGTTPGFASRRDRASFRPLGKNLPRSDVNDASRHPVCHLESAVSQGASGDPFQAGKHALALCYALSVVDAAVFVSFLIRMAARAFCSS